MFLRVPDALTSLSTPAHKCVLVVRQSLRIRHISGICSVWILPASPEQVLGDSGWICTAATFATCHWLANTEHYRITRRGELCALDLQSAQQLLHHTNCLYVARMVAHHAPRGWYPHSLRTVFDSSRLRIAPSTRRYSNTDIHASLDNL